MLDVHLVFFKLYMTALVGLLPFFGVDSATPGFVYGHSTAELMHTEDSIYGALIFFLGFLY